MKLGVHDLLIREVSQSNEEVFENTKKLVEELDKLSYDRYWFAEHHGFENLLSVAPEILASFFLSRTKNLNIGTGGTMVMHYSPLKIAETFKTMEYLAPGRVDLGLGRAPGAGGYEIRALNKNFSSKSHDLFDEIKALLDYLQDIKPDDFIYSMAKAMPKSGENLPRPWMLGSTGQAIKKASEFGIAYSHAKFFSVETPAKLFEDYKKNFKQSAFADKAYISMSYQILISDDKEELEYLGKSFDYFHIQQYRGSSKGLIDPEELKDYKFTSQEESILKKSYDARFILKGSKKEIANILEDEIKTYGIDEILGFTPIYGLKNRIKTYKALKEIFE